MRGRDGDAAAAFRPPATPALLALIEMESAPLFFLGFEKWKKKKKPVARGFAGLALAWPSAGERPRPRRGL